MSQPLILKGEQSGLQTRIAATVNALRLFELARLLVRLDHVASFIVNANHSFV
jgi:hypothetical protein